MLKDALRTKMKDAGIDDDTINSTLEGDLNLDTLTNKVSSLISKAKSTAQDLANQAQSKAEGLVSDLKSQAQDFVSQAQSKAEGVVSDLQSQAEGIVSQVQSQAEGIVSQVQSQAENLVDQIPTQDEVLQLASQRPNFIPTQEDLPEGAGAIQNLTDSLDNVTSSIRSNIADAQGLADNLTTQSLQDYSSLIRIGQPSLMEVETGTSNILSRITNFFQPQQVQPEEIEMVNLGDIAPEISSIIAPEISSTIAPAISDLVSAGSNIATGVSDAVSGAVGSASEALSGVSEAVTGAIEGATGALEGIGAGLDMTGALAPIGALLGIVGGIFGIVESDKSPQEQAPILNPSSQFL